MANPFIGEIRMFGGSFAPAGWAFCDGQLLPISENDALFTLLGTTYGGDGEETFALPNLQSRVPMHMGNGFNLGETGGVEEVTLTIQQIPTHNHSLVASTNNAATANAQGNILAQIPSYTPYVTGIQPNNAFATNAIPPVGGSQPHTNIQPYLTLSFIISLFGIFPPPQ